MSQRVRQAIGARLVRLSGPARRIVDVAAVMGRAVGFQVMRHAAGLDEATALAPDGVGAVLGRRERRAGAPQEVRW